MEQFNEIREQIQSEITGAIRKYNKGIYHVSVRVGKTLAALKSIEEGSKVLITYPRVIIKKSWLSDMDKFKDKINNFTPTFTTFSSLKKEIGKKYDTVIIDECHKLSEANLNYLTTIKANKIVMLTGTLNYKTVKKLSERGLQVVYRFGIEEAIKKGLVKDYRITIKMIDFNHKDKAEYDRLESTVNFWESEIGNEDSKYPMVVRKIKLTQALSKRANFLYVSSDTINATKSLLEKDKKTLIYAYRTDIADMLTNDVYHSKNKDEPLIDEFKESASGHLATVNSIDMGVTIKNLHNVIFQAYDSNTENFQQKMGRSLLEQYTGDISNIIVMCMYGTRMEDWLMKALASLDNNKIFFDYKGVTLPYREWFKKKYPNLELYIYNGSICYFYREEKGVKLYKFLNSDLEYSLKNLIKM